MDPKKLDNFFPRYSTNDITYEFIEKQVSTTKMLKINTSKLFKNFSTVLNATLSSSSSSYDFDFNKLIYIILFLIIIIILVCLLLKKNKSQESSITAINSITNVALTSLTSITTAALRPQQLPTFKNDFELLHYSNKLLFLIKIEKHSFLLLTLLFLQESLNLKLIN
jgi:hypothetical protein